MNASAATPSSPAPSAAVPPVSSCSARLESVDLLRGFVMIVMALDHTRDFLHAGALSGQDPLNLTTTSPALFLTRWITHYCAPTFVFLAGVGAFLSMARGKSPRELSQFLLSRGAFLVVLEPTIISWTGWSFQLNTTLFPAAVIWAIGWSMIALAGLIHLPIAAMATICLGMIAGHNALDGLKPEAFGAGAWLWRVLHAGGPVSLGGERTLMVAYPLIPWIGVMGTGYLFGRHLLQPPAQRQRFLWRMGTTLTLGFVGLRLLDLYGDAKHWSAQSSPLFTLFSMLDATKYPPSLAYLLMTLGPALLVLAWLDRGTPPALRPLLHFGRVPLFYYLLHLPLIHALAVVIETSRFGSTPWLFQMIFLADPKTLPAGAGLSLPWVYVVWIVAVLLLYPVCRWFAGVKARNRHVAWLSYL